MHLSLSFIIMFDIMMNGHGFPGLLKAKGEGDVAQYLTKEPTGSQPLFTPSVTPPLQDIPDRLPVHEILTLNEWEGKYNVSKFIGNFLISDNNNSLFRMFFLMSTEVSSKVIYDLS